MRAIDPALPIDDVVVLSDAVQAQIANPRLVIAGVSMGLAAALLVAGFLESLLFEVASRDSLSVTAAALGVAGIAMLSSFVAARTAAAIDPLVAMRTE